MNKHPQELAVINFEQALNRSIYNPMYRLRRVTFWAYLVCCLGLLAGLFFSSARAFMFDNLLIVAILYVGVGAILIAIRSKNVTYKAQTRLAFYDDHLTMYTERVNMGNQPAYGGEMNMLETIAYADIDNIDVMMRNQYKRFHISSKKRTCKRVSYRVPRPFGEGTPDFDETGYILNILFFDETNPERYLPAELIAALEQYTGQKVKQYF